MLTTQRYEVGDLVMIYVDPLTMKSKEGPAKLVRELHRHKDVETWEVEFLDQTGKYYVRFIKAKGRKDPDSPYVTGGYPVNGTSVELFVNGYKLNGDGYIEG